jgi:hypothetical protein
MPNPTVTLPFKSPNILAGFAVGKGLATASAAELKLEFVIKDTLFDVFKTRVKEIRIPQSEIDLIRLQRGWIQDRLRIRLKSIKWLADLPGCDNGEVLLRLARRDRNQTTDFVHVLGHVQSDGARSIGA